MRLPSVTNFAYVLCATVALSTFTPITLISTAFADIQDPPLREHGAIRKLGRGIGNITTGSSEILNAMDVTNPTVSSSGIFSYGIVLGVGRTLMRLGAGIYEVTTFPFPSYRGGYKPVLPPTTPWVKGGYEEFPPELGFDSRMSYAREQNWNSRMP